MAKTWPRDTVEALVAGLVRLEPAAAEATTTNASATASAAASPSQALSPLPWFAPSPDGRLFYVRKGRIGDPTLARIYETFWRGCSVRAEPVCRLLRPTLGPDATAALREEHDDATVAMTAGWFAHTYVYTPAMFALFQGAFEGTAADGPPEQGVTSAVPRVVTTVLLYRYYRALYLVAGMSYSVQSDTDAKAAERLARAVQEVREVGKTISEQAREAIAEAVQSAFGAERCMTRERQRSQATDYWVAEHGDTLERLAEQMRRLTVLRIQLYESASAELLGLPADEAIARDLACSVDPPPPELVNDERRRALRQSLVSSLRMMSLTYCKYHDEGSVQRNEGEFLRWLLDQQLLERDVTEPAAAETRDSSDSLAYWWVRLASYARLHAAEAKATAAAK